MPLSELSALELVAIDAALAGEPVDPQYAELAELSLLLADAKPVLSVSRAAELDRRVATLAPVPARKPRAAEPTGRPWFLRPAYGAGLAIVLALAVLVVVLPRGGSSSSSSSDAAAGSFSGAATSGASAASSPSVAASTSTQSPASAAAGSVATGRAPATVPTPQSNGRRLVQSAQLSLSASNARMAAVAQELFDVVGSERGIVKHSQVDSGTSGYASFTLSIPTANLTATLARLAQLRYAVVASSSASSTDVNSLYLDDQRKLADARALRRSLLVQLQAADTTTAVDSLEQQIKDAESTIAADESALNGLSGQIAFSALSVTISSAPSPPTSVSSGHGFTLARAAHDALDVLKVVAGVALIALAVLVPLGLLAALGTWLTAGWRRLARRRALDAS